MKTALQNCTLIFETEKLKSPGKDIAIDDEFTLERMVRLINMAKNNVWVECTLNYWQGEVKPVITIKIL